MNFKQIFLFMICAGVLFSAAASALRVSGKENLPYCYVGERINVLDEAGAKVIIKDSNGKTVKTVRIGANGKAILVGLSAGYYIAVNGKLSASFLVAYRRKNVPSVVGLDAHIGGDDGLYSDGSPEDAWESFEKNLAIAKYSGAYFLRDRFRWGSFETEPGKWSDDVYKRYLAEVKSGFIVIPAVEGLPDWACSETGQNLGKPKGDTWRELFKTIALKYGNTIPYWQVWNEPNPIGCSGARFPGGITPDKYIDAYARDAKAGVMESGKKVKLILGGSAGMDVPWQKGLIEAGITKYIDVFDLHPYATEPFTFEPPMKEILQALDKGGFNGPVMGTEFDAAGPDKLAQMYTLWFTMDRRMREGALFKFDLRDWPVENGLKMGIANVDFSPKPDFAAMNIVSNRLAGATFIKTISAGPEMSINFIRDSNGRKFGTIYGKGKALIATIRTGLKEIHLIPASGGEPVKLKTINGVAIFPLKNEQFFYIENITDIELCKPLIKAASFPSTLKTVSIKGKKYPYAKISIVNPFTRLISIDINTIGNKDLRFIKSAQTVNLNNREAKEIVFPIALDKPLKTNEQNFTIVATEKSSGFVTAIPMSFTPEIEQDFSFTMDRSDSNKLDVLRIIVDKGAVNVKSITVMTDKPEKPMKLVSLFENRFTFTRASGQFSDKDRNNILMRVKLADGLTYDKEVLLSNQEIVDVEQPKETIDQGMTTYLAQPFKPRSTTLSAVSLRINNWINDPKELSIRIAEDDPRGRVVGRAKSRITTGITTFGFDKLITDIDPNKIYWIVTETAYSDQTRWCGVNPWLERPVDALMSYDGAGWMPMKPVDFAWYGFCFKTYK